MGRNAQRRREHRKRRQHARGAGRVGDGWEASVSVQHVTSDQLGEVLATDYATPTRLMLAVAYQSLDPKGPRCPGPLIDHLAEEAFECHGPNCPGGTVVIHEAEAIHSCDRAGELGLAGELFTRCPACTPGARRCAAHEL